MTSDAQGPRTRVDSDELRDVLTQLLCEHFRTPCAIAQLQRRAYMKASSFVIEELDVELAGGESLALLFKDLGRDALLPHAKVVKPDFLYNPLREIETYRRILAGRPLGAPVCYGADAARHWLFLERVDGSELCFEGDFASWESAAAWLAEFHAVFAGQGERLASQVPLVTYDREYYVRWMQRAQSMMSRRTDERARLFLPLEDCYGRIVDRLLSLDTTLLHGEFYASNVIIERRADGVRVCSVDWEMAAVGPGLIDLAALTAGNWSAAARQTMVQKYYSTLKNAGGKTLPWDAFLLAFDCCRLHQAIQWLGWSATWSPPATQAQDWLGEALRLAEKLQV
jgi:hypothetical protein